MKRQIQEAMRDARQENESFFLIPLDGVLLRKESKEDVEYTEFFKIEPNRVLFFESYPNKERVADITDLFESVPLTISDLKTISKTAKTGLLSHELLHNLKPESIKDIEKAIVDAANDLGYQFWQLASYVQSSESQEDMDTLAGQILDLSQGDSFVLKNLDLYKEAYQGFKRWMRKFVSRIPDEEVEKLQDYWSEEKVSLT